MKQELRKRILTLRSQLRKKEQEELSKKVCANILKKCNFNDVRSVGFYQPVQGEVDLSSLFFNSAYKSIFPKHIDGRYHMVEASNEKDFVYGAYNILEPKRNDPIDSKTIDLWFIPGVAFTRHGDRIGFGKGIYDRLLEFNNAHKVGICYSFQLLEDPLTMAPWDIRMDSVITELS